MLQLRARSKAADAGLMEGDEILAVNGYSCKDVSYERLVGLVEHAGHYLDLDIVRYVTCMCCLNSIVYVLLLQISLIGGATKYDGYD